MQLSEHRNSSIQPNSEMKTKIVRCAMRVMCRVKSCKHPHTQGRDQHERDVSVSHSALLAAFISSRVAR